MVHYVQGGYFIKGFAKHGPLHNPFAYGYFDHVPHTGWRGGHVTQTGLIYQGGALPEKYNGKWIAPNLLANNVDFHSVNPAGSTFTTKLEGEFLGSDDKRFRPVDIRTGPDGAVYVADWYDARANHVIPEDTWDKTTGRVYRVAPRGLPGTKPFDLSQKSSDELVDLLSHTNDWYARTALRLLADRRDASVVPRLLRMVKEQQDQPALRALWALNASGGFNEAVAAEFLNHPTPDVRAWTVRLLGDTKNVSASTASRLAQLAASEPSPVVRAQLACSARRLPADQGLPAVGALMRRPDDLGDRYVPLLLWWAIEDKAATATDRVLALFEDREAWSSSMVRQYLLERTARRFAAERTDKGFAACARLLELAPGDAEAERVVAGLDQGLAGTALPQTPAALRGPLEKARAAGPPTATLLRVLVRLGVPDAYDEAFRRAESDDTEVPARVALIDALGQAKRPGTAEVLLRCAGPGRPPEVRGAAVSALQQFDDPAVADALLKLYPAMPPDLRRKVPALLAGRTQWAAALLAAVEGGTVKRDEIPPDQLRRIALHKDPKLDATIAKLWGAAPRDTPEEKRQTIERLKQTLAAAPGDAAAGKKVFTTLCAQCHAIRGEGGRVGPDLTGHNARETDFLLTSIVDPSAAIRPEFAAYVLETTDGRLFNGPVVESGPEVVTVEEGLAPAVTRFTVARSQIKRMAESPVSRMPDGLIDALSPQQVRDLFAYVVSDPPPAKDK
jgi:putative heme-binding domain-containing protein